MRKKLTATADFSERAKMMTKGGEANRTAIAKWGLSPAAMQKIGDAFDNANAKQEKLKGDLHTASQEYEAAKKVLQTELSRWVSTLEANYGKTGEKLQEFGIEPRIYRPKKGTRQDKA
ncbi:MAG: hypothetical protein QME74_01260 [Candidatus Edwardsbacteria bacterium]|nr:hypothetical protein [Candidatus Edwardsbacteria bacterium]